MMVTEQPSRVIRPLKTSRIFYRKIEYLSSPQKKGLTGFFNRDRFLRRSNFLDPSSKNQYKSENQFLLAESVQSRGNAGKPIRVVQRLSSMTNVIKFVSGASQIPLDNKFPDKSRCCTFFGSPKSFYFKLANPLSVNSSMMIFLLIYKLILIYLSLIILAMLCQQNLSTELFVVSSKPRRNSQRKQIYHPQRLSLPHSPMGSNKSQVSFHQYQYELKSKLTVDNKKNLDNYVAASQLMTQTTRNKINVVSQFIKKKDTLVPKKMPIEPSCITHNPGMMVGSMLKTKKNDKQKSHSLKNIRAMKTSRGDMRYRSSRKNILKNKIQQELFSYKSLKDYENTMDYYLMKDAELLMSGNPIEYDVFLLKVRKEEEQRKRKNVRKWFHFPQVYQVIEKQ